MHLPGFISDLSLILVTAAIISLLFRWLKQPVVLGYLIAGFLLGPHITFLPTVQDTENIKIWGELGVIFLLFVLGLEFSFRKLFRVGKPAIIAASIEVSVMTLIGFITGRFLGWNAIESFFLGGVLAISSTTIIIKAFQELGIKTQSFASLVFGILIIEDLFAVILLAILAAVGSTRTLEGMDLVKKLGSLGAFLAILIPLGLALTPKLFRFIRTKLDDEMRVIASLSLCLGLVVLSTKMGFSPALGAFLMGAFLGETFEGERTERFLKPIRDLFGAIFFTSVGMLVNIEEIHSHLFIVLLLTVITIAGKIMTTSFGALVGGQDRRTSIQAGLSVGQIGEFSFIIATLGLSLKVVRPELYSLAVSVAILTTFTTPYLIQYAARLQPRIKGRSRSTGKDGPNLWDGHLVELEIHPHFKLAGSSLQDLKLREKFGVSLVAIVRGDRKLIAPNREAKLMPYDRIVVMGTDAQLALAERFLQTERFEIAAIDEAEFGLGTVELSEGHPFIGQTLRQSQIPDRVHGLVVGIERHGAKILNPDSTTKLHPGDLLWIYGNRDEFRNL